MTLGSARRLAMIFVFVVGAGSGTARADIVGAVNFDGTTTGLLSSSSNKNDATSPGGDMFGVRSRSSIVNGFGLPFVISDDSVVGAAGNTVFANDLQGIVGRNKTDAFFGAADTVNGNGPDQGIATWVFNVAMFTDLTLAVDIAAMGNFEAADVFTFTGQFDSGSEFTIWSFVANEAISHTYRAMDSGAVATIDDPLVLSGVGTILNKSVASTGAFDTYTSGLIGTGGQFTLRFKATTDGSDEAFGFDNITIRGTVVPEPSSYLLLVAGTLVVGVAFRRRLAAGRKVS